MEISGIHKTRTTPLHPESNGMVKRLDKTSIEFVGEHVYSHQEDWDKWIPLFLLTYHTSKHETTEYTPSISILGRKLRLQLDFIHGQIPQQIKSLSFPEYIERIR